MKESINRFWQNIRNCGWRKWLLCVSVLFVFASSLLVFSRGINWAQGHPDEHRVASWMHAADENPYILSRVYPEGLFVLARIFKSIGKDFDKLSTHSDEWVSQPFSKYADWSTGNSREMSVIYTIRHWNVVFMALSAVFVFLTAWIIFENLPVSIGAGLLYAFHPFVVEHAHYAETEAIMLFTGTLTLLLMTLSLKKTNIWIFAVASFIGGFAVASKFTLSPLVFTIPVCAVVLGRRLGWKNWQICLYALGMLLLFVAGFTVGTPKLYLAPGLFFEQARKTERATYGEMKGLLGEAAKIPHAALYFKTRCVLTEAAKCGWFWWVLCAGSIPLWFKHENRKILWAFPLFGLTYFFWSAFFFPWFRNQEFLPVIPFLSLSAVLPLYTTLKISCKKWRIAAATISACVFIALLFTTFTSGMKMASAFSSIETRSAASARTGGCAPLNSKYIFESYVSSGFPFFIARNSLSEITTVAKIEKMAALCSDLPECDYFFRAVNMHGRGNIDPFTGKLFPSRQRALDDYLSKSILLESWSISPGLRPMFSQVDLELYAYRPSFTNFVDVPLPQPAPIVMLSGRYGYTGCRVSSKNGLFGPVEAIGIVGKRTNIEFDPLPDGKKYYAVAVNLTGGTDFDVDWTRGFLPLRQKVPAGRAVLFTSTDKLSCACDAVPSSKVRMRGDDQHSQCIAVITPNGDVAARVLRRFGNEEAAREIETKFEITGDLRKAVDGEIPYDNIAYCGIPADVVGDFARFRSFNKAFSKELRTLDSRQSPKTGFQYVELPYVLDENTYRMTLTFLPSFSLSKLFAGIQEGNLNVEFPECDLQGATLISKKVIGRDVNGGLKVEFVIAGHRRFAPVYFGIKSRDDENEVFRISKSELTWDLVTVDKILQKQDESKTEK